LDPRKIEADHMTTQEERRFLKLTDRWKYETAHLSNVETIVEHPAYREIVAMGSEVLPWILGDLRCEPAHWFPALVELTGENPVPPESSGNIYEMADSWVKWGEDKGLTLCRQDDANV
jgi:hypothetical protein